MYIFNSPDHQYACALENSRMMQARSQNRDLGYPGFLVEVRTIPSGGILRRCGGGT
jgi:hypothetical protein